MNVSEINVSRVNILGVRIDNLARGEILKKIEKLLGENKFHQVATINPEFILAAREDEEFKNILNGCDINIADGFGIKLAFWKNKEKLKARIAGIDLMGEILKIADNKKLKVFLVANSGGLSTWEETSRAIKKTHPDLEISGINTDKNSDYELQIADCDIVFCNFGAPCQEKFVNSVKNDKIRLAMGTGGSFDFITGKIKRAPEFMRNIGLEWLWRLIQQPKRIKRIFHAVVVFPIKIIF